MNEVKLPPLPEWFATATQHLQADVQAYARAAIEANTQAVPDGWKLVPKNLTNEMSREMEGVGYLITRQAMYSRLLAASPQPAPQPLLTTACRHCNGSGESPYLSGGGPDAYDVTALCATCKGTGSQPVQQEHDGQLHDDGYFTWNSKKHARGTRPVQLPARFWVTPTPPAPQPERVPLTDEQKHKLALGRFSESWHVRLAIALIEDVETANGITKKGD